MKTKYKALIISFLSALLIVSVLCMQSVIPAKAKPVNTPSNQSFDKLPPGLAPAVARTFQENLPESYNIKKSGKTYKTINESHGMRYAFSSNGLIIQSADKSWKWGMALKKWGYEGKFQSVPDAEVKANDQTVEYTRGKGLTEWYKNTIFGLEQGFTLTERPDTTKAKGSLLALEIAISGTLTPKLNDNTLLLQDKNGETLSRYTGLFAYDSKHQKLPAHLVLADNTLQVLVDDSKALYPVTIDPWIQKAKLTASDGASSDNFGKSVAVDNDTVVVGSSSDHTPINQTGSAYVFEKSENGWSSTNTYATKLLATDGQANDYFGWSVDIHHTTIVVGAYGHDTDAGETNAGSAYVFVRPGASWADAGETLIETAKLTSNNRDEEDKFGYSVAIDFSSESVSHIIVVGAYWDDHAPATTNTGIGAAYVFEKNKGDSWTTTSTPSTKLVASDAGAYNIEFGISLDVDNDTIVIGAHKANSSIGAAYVFVEPANESGWSSGETTTETAKLANSDNDNGDFFGKSVAISVNTIVVGSPGNDAYCDSSTKSDLGAAYVYEKPGPVWLDMTTETAKLTPVDCAASLYFGGTVAIDADTIAIGARGANSWAGAAYIFEKPESGWTNMTHTSKVTARDGGVNEYFGTSVAMDGEAVFVGANGASFGRGAVYVFKAPISMPWMIPLLLN